jgi:hypothetical protein
MDANGNAVAIRMLKLENEVGNGIPVAEPTESSFTLPDS